jgi:putative transcriptional regulator
LLNFSDIHRATAEGYGYLAGNNPYNMEQALTTGSWLQATALLNDTFFEGAVIYLYEVNEGGAVGLIVNRQFPRRLNELAEFSHSKPWPLYEGGPVDTEHLFILHNRPELVPGGRRILDNVFFGGDFNTAVQLLNNGILSADDIRMFIGYCGWDAGELEEETGEGSWQMVQENPVYSPSLLLRKPTQS